MEQNVCFPEFKHGIFLVLYRSSAPTVQFAVQKRNVTYSPAGGGTTLHFNPVYVPHVTISWWKVICCLINQTTQGLPSLKFSGSNKRGVSIVRGGVLKATFELCLKYSVLGHLTNETLELFVWQGFFWHYTKTIKDCQIIRIHFRFHSKI